MKCRLCGAEIESGLIICPECGARQRRRPKRVRCRYCGRKVSAQLVLCPSCGRELKPARFRGWGWMALGLLVVSLLALFFSGRLRFEMDQWRQKAADRLRVAASWLAEAPSAMLPTVILPSPTPTPTFSPTPTPIPSPEATDTPIPSPTPTPSPSPRPTPLYRTYKVQRGDTLAGIAAYFGVSVEALVEANGITDPTALQAGQELIIPYPPTPTPAPTVTPAPAATKALEASATPTPAATISPLATPTPTAQVVAAGGGEVTVSPSPTPRAPKPTATPTATPPTAMKFSAPKPVNPGDGAHYRGEEAIIELKWEGAGGLAADEEYVVHLGYVVAADGRVEWVLTEPLEEPLKGLSWMVPAWLHGRAPQEFGRTYRWFVQVERVIRDEAGKVISRQPISPPSEVRTFIWQ